MDTTLVIDEQSIATEFSHDPAVDDLPEMVSPRPRFWLWRIGRRAAWGIASATEWLFGLVSLGLGLSMLAALPIVQFLTLGYFLESSARVAQTGRLRDGVIGVRRAARIGGAIAASWVTLIRRGWWVRTPARPN